MEIGFAAVSVLLLFLYLRERSRYRQMEREYRYINERLCQLRKREESSYILIPSGLSLVRETGEKLNDLLEEYGQDMLALFDEASWQQATINGNIMAIPAPWIDMKVENYMCMRQDMLDKYWPKDQEE